MGNFYPMADVPDAHQMESKDVKIVGNFLERAITASDTGCTFAVML